MFRIFRDVRFSKDKSPYKTHIGGYVPIDGGGGGPAVPVPVYVQLGTRRFVAAGHYMMDAGAARALSARRCSTTGRARPGDDRREARPARFTLGSLDTLKKVPRGVDPDHPRAELLKRKGLIVSFPPLPKELLVSRALVEWLVERVEQTAPLVEWLALATE